MTKIRDFQNGLERVLVAPEGRERCQNDPGGVLNNPPGGMFPENVRFSMKSRLKDVPKHIRFFCCFFSFWARKMLFHSLFLVEGCFIFVTTSGNTNVDDMGIT